MIPCILIMIVALTPVNPVKSEMDWFAESAWISPAVRSHLQFAIDELVIPEGKFRGERYREHVQPWTGLLLREMDNPQWYNFAIVGCVQSGKSLFGFVLPLMKQLFENQETAILGVPTVDEVGRDKWATEVKPAIQASGFAHLLPTKGAGSKGGFPKEVLFRHGPRLKIMGGTGGDEKRSSYSTGFVAITEVDKMDEAGEVSREADPVTQMIARTMGRDVDERRVFMECTVSTTVGRIWQEYTAGSASRIACQCPYCSEYVTLERESLRGWQEAANVLEAEKNAYFACPRCDHALTADDRRQMNQDAVLVHRGQEVDKNGVITGEMPQTRTLGFRWNAFNNMFWSTGAIGVAEWRVKRTSNRESAAKELSQFYWTTPVDPEDVKLAPLDREDVAKRTAGYKKGIIPPECVGISVGIDTGKRQLDWTAMAWLDNYNGFVIDYGEQAVEADKLGLVEGLKKALGELRAYFQGGWHALDGEILQPSQVWIDSGYHEHTKPVYSFCLTANHDCKHGMEVYRPSKGCGVGRYLDRYSIPKKLNTDISYIGKQFHMSRLQQARQSLVHMNADYWKSDLHTRLGMDASEPSAIVLFETADVSGHDAFIDELLAEEQVEEWVQGKGTVIVWNRIRRNNHKLDSTYAATAAGGFIVTEAAKAAGAENESWFGKRKKTKKRWG